MAKFAKKKDGDLPAVSTASLPDIADVNEVGTYILAERAKKPQELQNVLTTALKVDKEANMGLISDIKQELRKVNALKVNYTTYEGDAFRNLQ